MLLYDISKKEEEQQAARLGESADYRIEYYSQGGGGYKAGKQYGTYQSVWTDDWLDNAIKQGYTPQRVAMTEKFEKVYAPTAPGSPKYDETGGLSVTSNAYKQYQKERKQYQKDLEEWRKAAGNDLSGDGTTGIQFDNGKQYFSHSKGYSPLAMDKYSVMGEETRRIEWDTEQNRKYMEAKSKLFTSTTNPISGTKGVKLLA